MIREIGVITGQRTGWIEVTTELKSGCSGCEQRSRCGAGLLSKALPDRRGVLEFAIEHDFSLGDKVELLIPENVMVRFSLLMYALPLLIGALVALLSHGLWSGSEGLVILLTFASVAVTLGCLKQYFKAHDTKIRKSLQIQILSDGS